MGHAGLASTHPCPGEAHGWLRRTLRPLHPVPPHTHSPRELKCYSFPGAQMSPPVLMKQPGFSVEPTGAWTEQRKWARV